MVRRAISWLGLVACLAAAAGPTLAETGETFSAWNVQFLYGAGFVEPGIEEEIPKGLVMFENFAAGPWGSSYFFVECLRSFSAADQNATEVYGEWFPSLSFRRFSGWDPGSGWLRDLGLTLGVIAGTKSTGAQPLGLLPGITAEFALPAFAFFSLGAYAFIDRSRFDGEDFGAYGTAIQITPSWSLPFRIGRIAMSFDGFADYIGEHGVLSYQILAQPQLRVDLTSRGSRPGRLFIGVEWQYWKNKYGIRDLDESFPQALLVWTFR